MTPAVSVILCTHNPRPAALADVLEALRSQALVDFEWDLVVIDNASVPELSTQVDLTAQPNARIVREDRLGLTYARLRGFAEARGDFLVFVDDDNVLHPDYLRLAARAMSDDATLGAAGGKAIARYEESPPTWFGDVGIDLACRDLGESALYASWKGSAPAQRTYPAFAPIGAGLVIRREAFAAYAAGVEASTVRLDLGRRGTDLASGEDNDIVMTVLEQGWRIAYLPQLWLEHIIPAVRLTRDYLARYAYGSTRTWVRVLDVHGLRPWRPINRRTLRLRMARAWLRLRAWTSEAAYVRWRGACGLLAGQAELAE
jgi:glycosyltransferase involved in cell wall biosynthesis